MIGSGKRVREPRGRDRRTLRAPRRRARGGGARRSPSTTGRAARATRCPRPTPARCCRSPTSSTTSPARSSAARCRAAARIRYGVRRAGNGVVRILIEQSRHLDLYAATMESTRILFAADPELPHAAIMRQLGEFWRGRVEAGARRARRRLRHAATRRSRRASRSPGASGTTLRRPGWTDPCDALSVRALLRRVPRRPALRAAGRPVQARRQHPEGRDRDPLPPLDLAKLTEPARAELAEASTRVRAPPRRRGQAARYADILPALLEMESAIHTFFDRVLVNTDDAPLRLNRLRRRPRRTCSCAVGPVAYRARGRELGVP